MSKRERKRILRNVKQMYFDIIMHKIGGRRMMALEGLSIILATFFNMPRMVDKEWKDKHRDVWELYQEINGNRGENK